MAVTREYTCTLPIDAEKIFKVNKQIEFVAGDKNRCVLNISITLDELPIDLTGNSIQLNILKPDGNLVIQDSVNNPSMVQIVNAATGQIKIILQDQSISAEGTCTCDITIFNGTDRATTQEFKYVVRANKDGEGAVQSSSILSYIDVVIGEIETAEAARVTEFNSIKATSGVTFATVAASNNTYTLDMSVASNFCIETADANAKTIAVTNIPQTNNTIITLTILLTYTNAATITFPNGLTWQDGLVPYFTTSKKNMLSFVSYDKGVTWMASYLGAW